MTESTALASLAERNASDIKDLEIRVRALEAISARRGGGIAAILATIAVTSGVTGLAITLTKFFS